MNTAGTTAKRPRDIVVSAWVSRPRLFPTAEGEIRQFECYERRLMLH